MRRLLEHLVDMFVTMAVLAGFFLSLQAMAATGAPQPAAKYVFLFIGDGMGLAQRTAAAQYNGAPLIMDGLPVHGLTATFAADRLITDSAAAATAMASGLKTNVGMVGVAPDGRRVNTIAEMAKARGYKVGIISSVSIDHATPAAFYAHVPERNRYYDIALALASSGFDFFGGGGLRDPANQQGNASHFMGDALAVMQSRGYRLVSDKETFQELKPSDAKIIAWNAWLQDSQALPYAMDATAQDISLSEFTAKAIDLLNNPQGFFLMVEGGKIDWALHANDATTALAEVLALDQALAQAVAFARKHPNDTLVVVTGDHECGGLSLGADMSGYDTDLMILKNQIVSFQLFTDEILLDLKVSRKNKLQFKHVLPAISRYFGFKFKGDPESDPLILAKEQIAHLKDAFQRSRRMTAEAPISRPGGKEYTGPDPLTQALTRMMSQKAGLGWTTSTHTGSPVVTSALGAGSERFSGFYDNTAIGLKIMALMGLGATVPYSSSTEEQKAAAN